MTVRLVALGCLCGALVLGSAACREEKIASDLTVEQLREAGLRKLEAKDEPAARAYFEHMITRSTTAAPEALYYVALTYYQQELYEEAYVRFDQIIDRYPASEWCDDAQYMKGEARLAGALPLEKDQTAVDQALEEFTILLEEYEDSPLVPEAQEGIARARALKAAKLLQIGKFYKKTGEWRAGAVYLEHLAADYPEFDGLAEAYFLAGECYRELGEPEPASRHYRTVLSRYPDSPYAAAAAGRLAAWEG
jgi:outer membrane protein assembly factor BamD